MSLPCTFFHTDGLSRNAKFVISVEVQCSLKVFLIGYGIVALILIYNVLNSLGYERARNAVDKAVLVSRKVQTTSSCGEE